MAIGAFTKLLGRVPKSLSGLGRGTSNMVQHGMIGTTGRQLRGAMKKPIRKGGLANPATQRNLEKIGLAGQAVGFLTLPTLMSRINREMYGDAEDDPRLKELKRQNRREAAQEELRRISDRRKQQELKIKEQRLQQIAPDLYNRIAAGRYLPAGAVVIGGAPRRDLLREFSEAMHEGAFAAPPTNVDISDLLA
jgi:hypothetical protein